MAMSDTEKVEPTPIAVGPPTSLPFDLATPSAAAPPELFQKAAPSAEQGKTGDSPSQRSDATVTSTNQAEQDVPAASKVKRSHP